MNAPAGETTPAATTEPATPDSVDHDTEAVLVVLDTIAEVVTTVGGSALQRRADAIELLERLLPDGGLTPRRYRDVVSTAEHTLRIALAAVHQAVGGLGSTATSGG